MRYWVYKCNTTQGYGSHRGDWEELFSERDMLWGEPRLVPDLRRLKRGDRVLAYQTNRNELVGVARAAGFARRGRTEHLVLKPLERVGVKVLPLKKADRRVAAIPALQGGPIRTIYEITTGDAEYLLAAAQEAAASGSHPGRRGSGGRGAARRQRGRSGGDSVLQEMSSGQGFVVDPEVRKAVETAAVRRACAHYRRLGYRVEERGKPFDLLCERGDEALLVEVKGTQTGGESIQLTANEVKYANTRPMELFVVHSLKVATRHGQVIARGGTEVVVAPWRPEKRRLSPMLFSYDLGPDLIDS